jgi:hypothetical protein
MILGPAPVPHPQPLKKTTRPAPARFLKAAPARTRKISKSRTRTRKHFEKYYLSPKHILLWAMAHVCSAYSASYYSTSTHTLAIFEYYIM